MGKQTPNKFKFMIMRTKMSYFSLLVEQEALSDWLRLKNIKSRAPKYLFDNAFG